MKQVNLAGQTKEQETIEFIREHEPPEGYFLGDSGGKDSVVLRDFAIKAGVKFQSYYSATRIDPPEIMRFIKKYHPDTIWLWPKGSLWKEIIRQRMPPTRRRRWC